MTYNIHYTIQNKQENWFCLNYFGHYINKINCIDINSNLYINLVIQNNALILLHATIISNKKYSASNNHQNK